MNFLRRIFDPCLLQLSLLGSDDDEADDDSDEGPVLPQGKSFSDSNAKWLKQKRVRRLRNDRIT